MKHYIILRKKEKIKQILYYKNIRSMIQLYFRVFQNIWNRRDYMKLLFFPITLALKIVESLLKLTGKLIVVLLGFVFTIIGIILSLTIIGAIIGIPMIILGLTMIIKGVF